MSQHTWVLLTLFLTQVLMNILWFKTKTKQNANTWKPSIQRVSELYCMSQIFPAVVAFHSFPTASWPGSASDLSLLMA